MIYLPFHDKNRSLVALKINDLEKRKTVSNRQLVFYSSVQTCQA